MARLLVALLVVLAAAAASVSAAEVVASGRARIAEPAVPSAAAAGAAVVAARAVGASDKCEPLPQDVCGATPGCVWCRCAAVPSACFTVEQAKHLPPAVFQCDWPSARAPGAAEARP